MQMKKIIHLLEEIKIKRKEPVKKIASRRTNQIHLRRAFLEKEIKNVMHFMGKEHFINTSEVILNKDYHSTILWPENILVLKKLLKNVIFKDTISSFSGEPKADWQEHWNRYVIKQKSIQKKKRSKDPWESLNPQQKDIFLQIVQKIQQSVSNKKYSPN